MGDGVTVPDTFAARREAQSIQVYDRRSSGASEASCTMVRILARVVISLFRARPEVYGRIIRNRIAAPPADSAPGLTKASWLHATFDIPGRQQGCNRHVGMRG